MNSLSWIFVRGHLKGHLFVREQFSDRQEFAFLKPNLLETKVCYKNSESKSVSLVGPSVEVLVVHWDLCSRLKGVAIQTEPTGRPIFEKCKNIRKQFCRSTLTGWRIQMNLTFCFSPKGVTGFSPLVAVDKLAILHMLVAGNWKLNKTLKNQTK